MSTELDLVHDYMNGADVPADELLVARSMLEDAIALEVGLKCPKDPLPIALPLGGRRSRLARWGIGATVAAAAAVAVLIFQVVPTSKVTPSEAAAAEISRLADVVQPVPPLHPDEWYQYQAQGVLSATVTSGLHPLEALRRLKSKRRSRSLLDNGRMQAERSVLLSDSVQLLSPMPPTHRHGTHSG